MHFLLISYFLAARCALYKECQKVIITGLDPNHLRDRIMIAFDGRRIPDAAESQHPLHTCMDIESSGWGERVPLLGNQGGLTPKIFGPRVSFFTFSPRYWREHT